MWHELFIAGALMLVLEGLLPVLKPEFFKQMMLKMAQMDDQQLRWSGLVSMILGALAIYLLKH